MPAFRINLMPGMRVKVLKISIGSSKVGAGAQRSIQARPSDRRLVRTGQSSSAKEHAAPDN
jgi:hypothetical protein